MDDNLKQEDTCWQEQKETDKSTFLGQNIGEFMDMLKYPRFSNPPSDLSLAKGDVEKEAEVEVETEAEAEVKIKVE